MTTQYEKIAKALRGQQCTTLDLMRMAGTTCPWKRIAEMEARGWDIRRGFAARNGKELRVWWIDSGDCAHCGEPNPPGRPKTYCSDKCRAANHRSTQKATSLLS